MQPSPGRFNLALLARRHRLAAAGLTALCCSSLAAVSIATAENPARYPYDPACAWGRLADGHGMLLRCLEPAEASALLQADASGAGPAAVQPGGGPRAVAASGGGAPAQSGVAGAPAQGNAGKGTAGQGTAGQGTVPAGSGVFPGPPGAEQRLTVSAVGPTVPDTGELPLADKKLGAPKDRYIECVTKNGGLSSAKARVVLRFLVRERGRAEGVEIKSFAGLSKPAAQCIADVVDRRYVGYPSAPLVGATLPIELSQVR
jgi:hypothetical protein